ncbi:MAG: hypothetical protein IKE43_13010 [Coriobacteriales bacterium]|nr:hypothetical protein [Coriobacteriales bacterium]
MDALDFLAIQQAIAEESTTAPAETETVATTEPAPAATEDQGFLQGIFGDFFPVIIAIVVVAILAAVGYPIFKGYKDEMAKKTKKKTSSSTAKKTTTSSKKK